MVVNELRIGLVGKPNVGKSTFFSAATQAQVDIANYPFCTIDPNVGVAFVEARLSCPCKQLRERLEQDGRLEETQVEDPRKGSLCQPRTGSCIAHRRFVPVALVDVAGLVPGASEGRGRGNAFLSDLANSDALIQVVDAAGSTDLEGQFLGGASNSEQAIASLHEEITFLHEELDAWIAGILNEGWSRGVRRVQAEGDKGLASFIHERLSGLGATASSVNQALHEFQQSTTVSVQPWEWDASVLRHLARREAEADHGVRAEGEGLGLHAVQRLLTSLRDDLGVLVHLAAHEPLEGGDQVVAPVARADSGPSDEPEALGDLRGGDLVGGQDQHVSAGGIGRGRGGWPAGDGAAPS